MEQRLTGKVAFVTGAGRGLGRAYALHLASIGADVVVNDINLQAARDYEETLTAAGVDDEIRALGRLSLALEADVTDREAVDAMVARAVQEMGHIDILVNNAGGALVPGPSLASEVAEADFRKMMDINFWGTVHCCQALSGHMKARGSGKIVNVGSQAGMRSDSGGGTSYSVAKAAIHHYTRKLASELGPFGITVNCIAPGFILSSRAVASGRNSPEARARLEPMLALRRLGMPQECATVVEFLVSDMSSYVTGQIIPICGGLCLF
jgi:NAD(P)-dependent dehydrogenase (short-subunit alcohol dehydrogenase family)